MNSQIEDLKSILKLLYSNLFVNEKHIEEINTKLKGVFQIDSSYQDVLKKELEIRIENNLDLNKIIDKILETII